MLVTRTLGDNSGLAVDDALRAMAHRDGRGGLLCYFPVVRGNPFQDLLYGRVDRVGLSPVPTYDAETTLEVARTLTGSGQELVVHVHWLTQVMAKAADAGEARTAMKHYLEHLHALADLGARLIWTVHNVLPHEEDRDADLEAELRREVVGLAERVHVMSPRTVEMTAPWFEIPQTKLLEVPHPAFHGVYPSWMSRERARARLGLPPDAVVLLMIGRIHPYKGLTELLDAFDELSESDPGRYVLLVAGPPDRSDETRAFRDRLLTHPSALAALRKLPDEEMQLYLRAADVAVLPYRRSLNSGVLALALTFGVPVVIRSDSGEAGRVGSGFGIHYTDDLLGALRQTRRLCTPAARDAAAGAADRIAPDRVAGAFATAVREWLDRD